MQARWEQPVSPGTRCDYFLRALEVARALDPEMKGASLPLPAFLLTLPRKPAAAPATPVMTGDAGRPLPWEDEICRDGRRAA